MQSTPPTFRHWHAPGRDEIGKDHIEFLHLLEGPTWITLDGHDKNRQRAIVTLLHGNEPSGLKAIHEFLLSGAQPATNLGIFIVSVNAALLPPILSHRYLPDEQDFNRCFSKDNNQTSNQMALAEKILNTLKLYQPEAIIDTHNTSGHSEPFAVAVSDSLAIQQLTQLFTRRLIVFGQSLGTLIEQDLGCPIVTIEFGGFLDPMADSLARDSLENFIQLKQHFNHEVIGLQRLKQPLRLEVNQNVDIHYASTVQEEADITIFNTIDQLNFSHLKPGTNLGWLGSTGLTPLTVTAANGENICQQVFAEKDGYLINIVPMTLFMATTDPYIAKHDCLMYLCPEEL